MGSIRWYARPTIHLHVPIEKIYHLCGEFSSRYRTASFHLHQWLEIKYALLGQLRRPYMQICSFLSVIHRDHHDQDRAWRSFRFTCHKQYSLNLVSMPFHVTTACCPCCLWASLVGLCTDLNTLNTRIKFNPSWGDRISKPCCDHLHNYVRIEPKVANPWA